MRTRTAVLSIVCLLFAVSASAQRYYAPNYSQAPLLDVARAPVFVENVTGGTLSVTFEVNGVLWPVMVRDGYLVRDLMVPVDGRMKIKEAKTVVLERNGTKEIDVKYCHYRSQVRGQQGWYFYRSGSTGPCEQNGRSVLSRILWPF